MTLQKVFRRMRSFSSHKKGFPRTSQAQRTPLSLRLEQLEPRLLLSLSVTDLTSLTALQLAQSLVGSGVAISNVSFTGADIAAGSFTGGLADGLGIDSGVILSSGSIAGAIGPNDSDSTTSNNGESGDSQLDALIPGYSTYDATVLEFDFVPVQGTLSFQYVFTSEEYNEYAPGGEYSANYNDVFGFFVNDQNIAFIPGTVTPVAINNINQTTNSTYFRNNDPSNLGSPTPYATEFDGFTAVLQATATGLTPGVLSHIKLAIADAGDSSLDSAVFLAGGSFVSGQADVSIVKTASQSSVAAGGAFSYTLTVANTSGTTPATGVVVSDLFPSGINYVSSSSSQGTTSVTSGTLTAALGTLAVGGSATVTINATASTSSAIVNQASVTSNEYDPNLNNNTSTVSVNSASSADSISGVKFIDLNGNGVRDGGLIQGTDPDAIFIIDVSGSTSSGFQGTPVGDQNSDGIADTILDAEIAGFIALNDQLIAQGFGATGKVAIVAFSSSATALDMNSALAGTQYYTTPTADTNGNGVYDVIDKLKALTASGATDYQDAFQKAITAYSAIGAAAGNGNVIFLSDGEPNDPSSSYSEYTDEVATLKAAGANVRAFGVGTGAALPPLQQIDAGAQIFTSTNELLSVFSGAGTGGGTSYTEPVMAGVTIYLDTNNNGVLNSNEPSTITASDGSFSFTGLTVGQTYIVREVVPVGYTQTSGPYTIVFGTTPSESLTIGNMPIATTADDFTISGWKFNDLDGDGLRDPGEPGLENWEIFLDSNADGTRQDWEEYTLTDEDGYFEFTDLDSATYRVAEVVQTADWYQTYPGSPNFPAWHTVTISASQGWLYVKDLLFGNHEKAPSNISSEVISGTKFDDLNGNGVRDGGLIQGTDPDAVFIIDISGSTTNSFIGTPVGDLNGSGGPNTILDAEIAGFIALNQQLIVQGFGNTAHVAIVAFSSAASNLDMDPVASGVQYYTTPLADKNNNSVLDVEEVLKALASTGGTDYEQALQAAITAYSHLATSAGNGNVIFLSDGEPNYQNYTDDVTALKATGANVRAFGVGTGATLSTLQQIDTGAQIFTSTNELLNVFSGAGTGTGGSTTFTEPGIGGITVYLDLDNDGVRDSGEPYQITATDGSYTFSGLEDGETYIIREEVPAGYVQTSGPYTVTVGSDSTLNLNFGNMQQEEEYPDLLAKSLTLTGGPIVVPGDKLTLSFIISNVGTETAVGPVNLYFYASTDGTLDAGDTLMGSLTNQKINLDPGEDSKAYVLKNYVLPPTMLPDDMTLIAQVEPADSSIDEINLTNNTTSTAMNVRWRFGSWDNDGDGVLDRKNVKLTVNDASQVLCTFTMSGEGYGELDGPGFNLMTLNNSTLKSKVAVKTTGGSATIQDITCDGDLGDLKASTTSLGDSFSSVGTVASLLMNDAIASGKQIPFSIGPAIGSGKPGKIGFHQIKNVTFSSQSALDSLTFAEWLDDGAADTITALSINKLEAKGDQKGGLDGNFMADAVISDVSSTMSALTVNGLLNGSVRTAGSIKTVKLVAAVDSTIFAGISNSVTGLPTSGITNLTASIGSVKMGGKKNIQDMTGNASYGSHSYANTNISAPNMGAVSLIGVQRNNSGLDHGLAGDTFKSIKVTQPDKKSYSWDAKTNTWKTSPVETWGDFTVNLL